MGNADLTGMTLAGGKYVLGAKLGAGGAGSVYLGTDSDLNEKVAIKILKELDDKRLERFRREAKATRKLEHPNILRLFDFGYESEVAYIVMEFLDGRPLNKILKEEFPVKIERSFELIKQACRALSHAHEKNIVHRDIKPGNMMVVDTKGSRELLKLVDFGIAKILDDQSTIEPALTTTGRVFGSPAYMSPEQTKGYPVDNRSDIYSLGCVLYECLTGTPPHVGDSPIHTIMMHQTETPVSLKEASMGQEFPHGVELLVQRMLAREPRMRYQNIEQVIDDIDRLDFSRPARAPKRSQLSESHKPIALSGDTTSPTEFSQKPPTTAVGTLDEKIWLFLAGGLVLVVLFALLIAVFAGT